MTQKAGAIENVDKAVVESVKEYWKPKRWKIWVLILAILF